MINPFFTKNPTFSSIFRNYHLSAKALKLPGARARCEDDGPSLLLTLFAFDFWFKNENKRKPETKTCIYSRPFELESKKGSPRRRGEACLAALKASACFSISYGLFGQKKKKCYCRHTDVLMH